MRNVLYLIPVLALMGCQLVEGPTFMPSGYTYHQDEYKAPPGPEADDIGYPYSAEMNEEVQRIWSIIAEDLISQMEDELSVGPGPVYLEPLPKESAFNTAYDHALREDLRYRGYTLVSTPDNALHIRYEAIRSDEETRPKNIKPLPIAPGLFDFLLVLSLYRDSVPLGTTSGLYKVPAYGYEGYIEGPSLFEPIAGGKRK